MVLLVNTAERPRPRRRRRRFCRVAGVVREVGTVRRASEVDPSGRGMRLVPVGPEHHVRCQTWISRDGLARARYYDWVDKTHRWGAIKQPDARGMLAVGTASCGGRKVATRVPRAIALAWIDVPPCARGDACAVLLDASGSVDVHNIGWLPRSDVRRTARAWVTPRADGAALSDSDDDSASESGGSDSHGDSHGADDVWRPLRYVRRTQHTLVDAFDATRHGNAWISSAGALRNELGRVRVDHDVGEPSADVGVFGRVCVADAVAQTFGAAPSRRGVAVDGDASAGELRLEPRAAPALRPAEQQVYGAFAAGEELPDLARARGCTLATAHSHLYRALSSVELDDVPPGVWSRLIPAPVRRVVQRMYTEGDGALSDTLSECHARVHSAVGDCAEWFDCDQWAALRYARLLAMRRRLHARTLAADSITAADPPGSTTTRPTN